MKYKNFEDFMQYKHADQYEGLKDGMIDDLQRWYEDLDIDDWLMRRSNAAALKLPAFAA